MIFTPSPENISLYFTDKDTEGEICMAAGKKHITYRCLYINNNAKNIELIWFFDRKYKLGYNSY